MDLREYLFYKRISVAEFSRIIDYSRIHISEIVLGRRKPSPRLAKIISKATNGEVTVEELLTTKDESADS